MPGILRRMTTSNHGSSHDLASTVGEVGHTLLHGATSVATGAAEVSRKILVADQQSAKIALRDLNRGGVNNKKLVQAAQRMDYRIRFKLLLDVPRSSPSAFIVFVLLHVVHLLSVINFFTSSRFEQHPEAIAALNTSAPNTTAPKALNSMLAFLHQPLSPEQQQACMIEFVCTFIFSAELLLRFLIGTLDVRTLLLGSFNFWVDFFSTLPLYLEFVVLVISGGTRTIGGFDISGLFLDSTLCLRALRALKLLRHYPGLPVLTMTLHRCARAVLVPVFGMFIAILLFGGLLFIVERDKPDSFDNMWDAMYVIFWLICTGGYDGDYGSGTWASQVVYGFAVVLGIGFTTMPITIIGEAFASSWEEKEKLEVSVRMHELLLERGLTPNELNVIFQDFDITGDGALDYHEFKHALHTLGIHLPIKDVRHLYGLFDRDGEGSISYHEFSTTIFPNLELGGDEEEEEEKKASMLDKLERTLGVDLDGNGEINTVGMASCRHLPSAAQERATVAATRTRIQTVFEDDDEQAGTGSPSPRTPPSRPAWTREARASREGGELKSAKMSSSRSLFRRKPPPKSLRSPAADPSSASKAKSNVQSPSADPGATAKERSKARQGKARLRVLLKGATQAQGLYSHSHSKLMRVGEGAPNAPGSIVEPRPGDKSAARELTERLASVENDVALMLKGQAKLEEMLAELLGKGKGATSAN